MAGPGGGSSSGGGFGGGSFGGGGGFSGGGGFGGGSFGGNFGGNNNGGSFGGHHHGHHHHHHGPYFGGPFFGRRTYVGGGCGGALFSFVVIGMFIMFGAFWLFAQPGEITINGEPVYIVGESFSYDEGAMQDYANTHYEEVFGAYEGYEDNILLVFLANEEADGYYTIAWVGDNIRPEINEMFGEYSEYGEYMNQYINTNYYGYTLDANLADVVRAMEDSIVSADFGSSFRTDTTVVPEKKSELKNYTQFDISKKVVNDALTSFTQNTGIPLVIVVDMAENVFGGSNTSTEIIPGQEVTVSDSGENINTTTIEVTGTELTVAGVVFVGVIVAAVFVAVMLMKKKKPVKRNEQDNKNDMPWES